MVLGSSFCLSRQALLEREPLCLGLVAGLTLLSINRSPASRFEEEEGEEDSEDSGSRQQLAAAEAAQI